MVAKDVEQAAFESWLETTSPSGDSEEVQSKWLNSRVYAMLKEMDNGS